jgi:glutamine amidotransferase
MQWNQLRATPEGETNLLLDGLDDAWVYFVHSLAPVTDQHVIATTEYGGSVVAAAARENVYATQFHPEKSAAAGLRLLGNFLNCCREVMS